MSFTTGIPILWYSRKSIFSYLGHTNNLYTFRKRTLARGSFLAVATGIPNVVVVVVTDFSGGNKLVLVYYYYLLVIWKCSVGLLYIPNKFHGDPLEFAHLEHVHLFGWSIVQRLHRGNQIDSWTFPDKLIYRPAVLYRVSWDCAYIYVPFHVRLTSYVSLRVRIDVWYISERTCVRTRKCISIRTRNV